MSRPTTASRYRGATATYVQAWICEGPAFDGIVYSAEIMLDKLAAGCDVVSTTMVRHDDGSRESLRGTVASAVYAYREAGTE